VVHGNGAVERAWSGLEYLEGRDVSSCWVQRGISEQRYVNMFLWSVQRIVLDGLEIV